MISVDRPETDICKICSLPIIQDEFGDWYNLIDGHKVFRCVDSETVFMNTPDGPVAFEFNARHAPKNHWHP